jgi:hypothetical protein
VPVQSESGISSDWACNVLNFLRNYCGALTKQDMHQARVINETAVQNVLVSLGCLTHPK